MSGLSARDRAVARIAARQKTMITTEQLAECGLEKDAVGHRVRSGRFRGVLACNRPCRGAARLADVIADDTAMGDQPLTGERALLRLVKDAGLPMPETNVKFGRFEADFVWREQKVIVELDSATYHSGPRVFQRDREKSLVFRGAGFDVLRPTRHHVIYEGPRVLVLLAQALARRDS